MKNFALPIVFSILAFIGILSCKKDKKEVLTSLEKETLQKAYQYNLYCIAFYTSIIDYPIPNKAAVSKFVEERTAANKKIKSFLGKDEVSDVLSSNQLDLIQTFSSCIIQCSSVDNECTDGCITDIGGDDSDDYPYYHVVQMQALFQSALPDIASLKVKAFIEQELKKLSNSIPQLYAQ